jgi:radical SAM family uncharacterized protein
LKDFRAEYGRILPGVTNPAQYVGGEWNSIVKPRNGGGVDVTFCLAFPDTYAVGMSHAGLQILYGAINRRPDVACERAFTPWVDMEKKLREAALPLVSLETFTPLSEFDIVGFSLQYEMNYTNVLTMLDLGGIPLLASERKPGDPLVIAGGPCALHPEPMADFVDIFFLGDAEDAIHVFLDAFRAARAESKGSTRKEFLAGLVTRTMKDGACNLYAPALYEPQYADDGRLVSLSPTVAGMPAVLEAAVVSDLDSAFYPTKPIVPYVETVHDRITLEIMRGCPHRCRFCEASHTRRPPRLRSVENIVALAEESYKNTGHSEISLVSLSSGDHPHLADLVLRLNGIFDERAVNISLPSLRIDEKLPSLPPLLNTVRKSALTLAPEAATERLRKVIGKRITNEDLFKAIETACEAGWRHVKLYFMIGLPTETDEDVAGIAQLAEQIVILGRRARHGGQVGKGLNVNVSVAPFVPKPHTPFQWQAMDSIEELKRKRALLAGRIRSRSITFKSHRIERSFMEAVMARGNRRLGKVIRRAWETGCRFDGWDERFLLEDWLRAFADVGLDPGFYAHRPFRPDELLPWQHILAGPTMADLAQDRDTGLSTE